MRGREGRWQTETTFYIEPQEVAVPHSRLTVIAFVVSELTE